MRRKKYLEMVYDYRYRLLTDYSNNHYSVVTNVIITDDKRIFDLRSLYHIVREIILRNHNNLFTEYLELYDPEIPFIKRSILDSFKVFDSPEFVNQNDFLLNHLLY